jgi:hypothetical protein
MKRARYILKISDWFISGLIVILASTSALNPNKWEAPFKAHVSLLIEYSFSLIVIFAILGLSTKIAREFLESRTANRQEIRNVANALHKYFFQDILPSERYRNRVTLFKACRNPFTNSKYLKVYVRSGTQGQKSKTCFRIHDDEEDKNEGIVGHAYFKNGDAFVVDLPIWTEASNGKANRKYAERGRISPEKAANLGIKSRSISAVVVRARSGQIWGVLAIDSQDPQGALLTPPKQALVNLTTQLLTPHL